MIVGRRRVTAFRSGGLKPGIPSAKKASQALCSKREKGRPLAITALDARYCSFFDCSVGRAVIPVSVSFA
jgi:hypothetical protein